MNYKEVVFGKLAWVAGFLFQNQSKKATQLRQKHESQKPNKREA